MREYNEQIEREKGDELRLQLQKMVEWYQKQYNDYNLIFQSELNMELANKTIYEQTKNYDLDYTFSFSAILTPFCVADFLTRHILSTYSYGPEAVSDHITMASGLVDGSWFECKANAVLLTELLQEYLNMNNEGEELELGVLLEERSIRSGLTHAGSLELCMSIIRYYNVIRKMLVFMNNELGKELAEFEYPKSIACDVQGLMEHIALDDFQNRTTVLVVGSMHDIPKTYLELLADLPWNIVIDFDANPINGGLRSEAKTSLINDRYWDLTVVNNVSIRNNFTEWLKCGDYILPNPNMSIKKVFPNKVCLNLAGSKYYRWTKRMFDALFRQIASEQNPVSILFLYHDLNVLSELVDKAEEYLVPVSYKIASAYYWEEKRRQELVNHVYKDDISIGEDYSDRFQMFPCNILSFFSGLSQYYSGSMQRTIENNIKELPSLEGSSEIPLNLQIRLEKYFDVLYVNCGNENYDDAQVKIDDFHNGALAPWCAYANNEVVNLISEVDYERWKNKIKSTLGRIQEGNKKVVHLVHQPGIGGTTMLRYLGWDFHMEYPVLVAQKYNRGEVRTVLQDLYDIQSKAFIVLADENFVNTDDLETDIKVLARPCVLIIVHRNTMTTFNDQTLFFNKITKSAEKKLKYKFNQISSLSIADKKKKEDGYDEFIQKDPSMKSPFFIGLYYLDKNFKHLPDYVDQAFNGIYKDEEYKAIGYIALCHIYGETTLPKIFINKIMGISAGKSFLDINQHAKSILYLLKVNGGTVTYQSKHILISQRVLDICSQKLFRDNYKNVLIKWSNLFIDDIAEELRTSFQDNYKTIVERMYVRTRNLTRESDDFSKLIQEISVPEYRVQTLAKLAEETAKIALLNDPDKTPMAYVMAAHCYGHLGRLYSKGTSITLNYEKAVECCKTALNFLEECNYQDYSVYHMYGDVKRLSLSEKQQRILRDDSEATPEDYEALEAEIEDILKQYEISDLYGNHAYAQSTSIKLLIDYLSFVYKKKGIDSIEKMQCLSEQQSNYKMKIEDIFESIDWDSLADKEKDMFNSLHDKYESGIMYHDYSHMEVYHQNKLDYLITHQGSVKEVCRQRSRLILAKLGKRKTILSNGKVSYMDISKSDIDSILSLLEQSFEQSIDATNYRDRKNRSAEYKRWIVLAKYSDRPVEKGIIYMKEWINLVERGLEHDPLPYYYLSVLYYLSALEGNIGSIKLAKYASIQACTAASNRTESTYRIKDILVKGKGIGQLRDIGVFNDVGELEVYENIAPVVFRGKFEDVESARGIVILRSPSEWLDSQAKFTVRENNSLTKDFLTHTVEFYGGFCYEGIVAINSSVRDITSQESIPSVKVYTPEKESTRNQTVHTVEQKRVCVQANKIIDFIPSKILDLNTVDFIIQGTVYGDKEGGIYSGTLPTGKEEYRDKRAFAEFILELNKVKVICKAIDEKGRYRLALADDNISIQGMREYGSYKRHILSKEEKFEPNDGKINDNTQKNIAPLPNITEPLVLFDIVPGKKCVSGKIEYNGNVYDAKITVSVSPKKIRDWQKKKKVLVKVTTVNKKEFIVRPV